MFSLWEGTPLGPHQTHAQIISTTLSLISPPPLGVYRLLRKESYKSDLISPQSDYTTVRPSLRWASINGWSLFPPCSREVLGPFTAASGDVYVEGIQAPSFIWFHLDDCQSVQSTVSSPHHNTTLLPFNQPQSKSGLHRGTTGSLEHYHIMTNSYRLRKWLMDRIISWRSSVYR